MCRKTQQNSITPETEKEASYFVDTDEEGNTTMRAHFPDRRVLHLLLPKPQLVDIPPLAPTVYRAEPNRKSKREIN